MHQTSINKGQNGFCRYRTSSAFISKNSKQYQIAVSDLPTKAGRHAGMS
jgi:hypothetical protein